MTGNFDSWEYVPGTEHHGPYVTTSWGRTVADCYTMSNPDAASVLNGGTSYPINHCGDDAEAHAQLIAAAPELLEAAQGALAALGDMTTEEFERGADKCVRDSLSAAIAKATGEAG